DPDACRRGERLDARRAAAGGSRGRQSPRLPGPSLAAASRPRPALAEAGGLARHRRLAVGGLVLVDDALARGLVEQPGRRPQRGRRGRGVTAVRSLAEPAYGGLQLRLDRLVAQPATFVRPVALDLRLDVGHAGLPRKFGVGAGDAALKASSAGPWRATFAIIALSAGRDAPG